MGLKHPQNKPHKKAKFKGRVFYYKARDVYVKATGEPDLEGYLWIFGYEQDDWCHKSELRPLTKKERGE